MTAELPLVSIRVLVEGALKAMILARVKAVALPLSLAAAGLFVVVGSAGAYQDDGQKAEPKDKPPAEAKPEKKAEKKADANKPEKEKPKASRGMMGGMGGFGGGGGEPSPGEMRQEIAGLSATVAKFEENPKTKAVLEALDQPFTLRSTDQSTLDDLLKQIKNSLTTADGKKVPIYVDPELSVGPILKDPVAIDLEDVPLRVSLRLALKQLSLAYCVRDGVLIISTLEGVLQELKEAESELMGLHPDKVIIGPGGARFMGSPGGMM